MKFTKPTQMKFILNPIMISILGLSLQAQAANDTETMVVTANRSAQSISDIAGTVLVIEAEQITQQAQSGVEFKDLLANLIPSLDVGSQSRTNSGQNMRGRTALVMIDGISLNSSRGVSRQFDSINPFNIARIEVISGASAMYGGGGTGGIINIITKKGNGETGVHAESSVGIKSGFNSGEDIQYQVAQSISNSTDKMNARLGISYDQTGAMYDSNGDMVLQDATQTSSQYVSQLDIMGNVGYDISDTKRVELMAQYYNSGQDSDYGIDYGYAYSKYFNTEDVDMVEGYDLDDQAQTVRYMVAGNYIDSDFYKQTVNLQLYSRYESMRFNPFYYGTLSASEQDTSVVGAKLVLTAQPTDALNIIYGVDLELEKFEATQTYYNTTTAATSNGLIVESIGSTGRYPDIETMSSAVFLQTEYELNSSWNLHAGVRYQYSKIEVGDFVDTTQQYYQLLGDTTDYEAIEGGSNHYSNTLFNTGALYKINQDQQVWLNFSQGFEIPDSAKYYGQGEYNSDGSVASSVNVSENPLEGIKTDSVELGWRLNKDSLSTQVTAYYSASDKSVEYNTSDYSIDIINDDIRIYGLETQIEYYVNQAFSLGGNFNYIVSETKNNGSWEELTIDSASPSKASAYINWQTNKTNTRLQTKQMFNYTDADNNELEGYNTVDLLTSIALPVGKISLGITNLFNTEYQTLWAQRATHIYTATSGVNENLFNFEGQGRTYSANYSVKF